MPGGHTVVEDCTPTTYCNSSFPVPRENGRHCHRRHRPAPEPAARLLGPMTGSAPAQSRSWSESGLPAVRPSSFCGLHPGPRARVNTDNRLRGRLACSVASDTLTATRQFSCLPNCPQYCRATPTECVPCSPVERNEPAIARTNARPEQRSRVSKMFPKQDKEEPECNSLLKR